MDNIMVRDASEAEEVVAAYCDRQPFGKLRQPLAERFSSAVFHVGLRRRRTVQRKRTGEANKQMMPCSPVRPLNLRYQ